MKEGNSQTSEQSREILFPRPVAAQLARVSLGFLDRLEKEFLIQPRTIGPGETGYSADDIAQIARIRRLHEDLGLDLEAVEIILQMRRQILDLLNRVQEMEKRLAQRERELLAEIQDLRRRLRVTVEVK
jgi:DNA-binding transcriptional MerR regulator|uniref:MerR family transcriptional regulator n=1 Tax=Desulfobacca acetoxidans TaxID=60893 RepID=A0A7C3WIU3_9BACT